MQVKMKTIGIIGAGEVGAQIARAAILNGYKVVIANSEERKRSKDLLRSWDPGHLPPQQKMSH